ncbi:MAG: hypothetical protein SGBAC_007420 [Bacillariaceae sp.]
MGAVVSTIAFPHPPKDYSEDELRARPDLKFIVTKSGIKIPAVHIQKSGAKFTIIYSHGNAEDVGISLYYLDVVSHILQASVIAYEYPGYSISEGEPSEENCYEAINAAYKYATETAKLQPSEIVLFGRSLGTGPTVDLCSRSPDIGGCILQSPLESGIRCFIGVCSSYSLYPLDIFRNYSKIEDIKCPVFIMHGTDDKVVPCHNGKALYGQLQERSFHESVDYPPVWIEGRGHNDMPQDLCLDHSRKFLLFLERRQTK